jgi:serine/threonine protein kinase
MSCEPPPNFLLVKYGSVEFIDEGVDGCVYKCIREGTATAVKILHTLDPIAHSRFDQEIGILKRFDHPNIVKLLDADETDGHHWFESELADESHFGKMFPYLNYTNVQRRNCFIQICLGVLALHEAEPPIIHRDLKPRNILVFRNSEQPSQPILKIADFGLSAIAGHSLRLTTSGQVLGTGLYMAPELHQNPLLRTPECDIYSLGVTFLEACTGATISEGNLNHVPEAFKPIITKMIQYSPNERYHSLREILTDLYRLSMFKLLYGREMEPGELLGPTFSTNTAGKLARIIELMYDSTPENIETRITEFEQTLDSLGVDVRDNKAHSISSIPAHVAKLIDEVLPERLCRLIERFDYAADGTKETDFFFDGPDKWGWFLGETFKSSSHRPTRHACLTSLAKIFVRYDSPWLRQYVGHLIYRIVDPSDVEFFADRLREQGRQDLADLLEGVPYDRSLDIDALKLALRIVDAHGRSQS